MKLKKYFDTILLVIISTVIFVVFCWAGTDPPYVEITYPTDNQIFRSSIQQLTAQGRCYTQDAEGFASWTLEYWVDDDGDGTADEPLRSWQSVSTNTIEKSELNGDAVTISTMDTRNIIYQPYSESVYRSNYYLFRLTGLGNNDYSDTDIVPFQIRKARIPTW